MKDHFLLVAGRDRATRSVAGVLEEALPFRYSICSDCDEALATIAADTPTMVLSDLASLDGRAAEFLAAIAGTGLPVGVAVVVDKPVGELAHLSPLLALLDTPPDVARLPVLIASFHERIEKAQKPYFVTSDYLYLAELAHSTEALHLHLEGGTEALLEIVDGEVWNAWYEERTAEGAVAAVAVETPRAVASTHLKRAPSERQTGWPTSTVLGVALGRGEEGLGALPVAEDPQAVLTPAVAVSEVDPAPAAESALEEPPPEPAEDFDALFAAGIEATLSRRYGAARAAFERALELRPHDKRAQFNLDRLADQND